jgi:hypothetical protein
MAKIKGTSVTLYTEKQTGTDPFGNPIVKETAVVVNNVLIGEPSTDDITSSVQLYGKQIKYMLAIPKGDENDWTDRRVDWVDAYGITHNLHTFGFPITGIEGNIPPQLPWHMKVRCEEYG